MRGFARLVPRTIDPNTNPESVPRNGPTCGIGIGTVVILLALEKVGQTWGKKNFAVKYVATSRAVVVMVVFTLISYLVNRNRGQDLVWAISKVNTHGIAPPKAHDTTLLSKVAARAFAPVRNLRCFFITPFSTNNPPRTPVFLCFRNSSPTAPETPQQRLFLEDTDSR